jgi:hypothetical protein
MKPAIETKNGVDVRTLKTFEQFLRNVTTKCHEHADYNLTMAVIRVIPSNQIRLLISSQQHQIAAAFDVTGNTVEASSYAIVETLEQPATEN